MGAMIIGGLLVVIGVILGSAIALSASKRDI